SGVLEWTPRFDQAGLYTFDVFASDGQAAGRTTVTLTVTNANAAPEFDALAGLFGLEGSAISFRAFAFDPDNPDFAPQFRLPDGLRRSRRGSLDVRDTEPAALRVAHCAPRRDRGAAPGAGGPRSRRHRGHADGHRRRRRRRAEGAAEHVTHVRHLLRITLGAA